MSEGGPSRRALADSERFELLVVGGGATGLGVALEAARRGLSVALCESHDFASGTSSRSTKLLHGGVRYLAQGRLGLVREALAERAAVLQIAPHLAQPLSFVMPAYAWWQRPFYGSGLLLYDLLAGRARLGHTRWLDRQATLAALPGLRESGLRGGASYWDGQFDDARLALALARTAEREGARLFNHTQVLACQPRTDGLQQVELRERLTGRRLAVQAGCVVNATGVWADGLRRPNAPGPLVRPSQGIHLVVDREFLPGPNALLQPRTRDGRVLFAVPWLGKVILGTTDTPRDDLPREPEVFAHERNFVLREASAVLARPVRAADVRSQWVGLRPLVAPPPQQAQATRTLSREHTIVQDKGGLVTVVGGKWTTYRAMAQDVLAHCMAQGLLPHRAASTRAETLVGAPAAGQAAVPLHQSPGLHLYGALAAEVLACPGADQALGMGLTQAMVRHAVRHEWARTVEDVLARRWRALFLDARQAAQMAPQVAALMHEEGLADPRLDEFLALCAHCLPPQAAA
jgi:glycerol-3-phosphate dehydrogenase